MDPEKAENLSPELHRHWSRWSAIEELSERICEYNDRECGWKLGDSGAAI